MTPRLPDDLNSNDYAMLHQRCAVCHWPMERRGRWLEVHHIVGGAGRRDIPENWCLLCNRCHKAVHDKLPDYPEIPKGAILTAKWEEDGYFDPSVLAKLKHRQSLPYEPCDIPDEYLAERNKRGGKPWPGQ